MLLADVVIVVADAALEQRERVLDGVGVPELAANVLFRAVIDGAVAVEPFARRGVDLGLIGDEV